MLRKVLRGVDIFSNGHKYFLSILIIGLVFITLYDVIGRQFGRMTGWAFDVEWFTYAAILVLSMGYAVFKGQHVRIDSLTARYSPWTRELLIALSYLVFVIPFMVFIAVYSWSFAWEAMETGELTLIGWYAPLWPVKFLLPIGCILMLPQCFAELTRHIYFLIKKERL